MHDIRDDAFACKGQTAGETGERTVASAPQAQSWRDVIKVHPAADLFPLMGGNELAALADDIKAHGLEVPIALRSPGDGQPDLVLDGRNRLDACELAGIKTIDFDRLVVPVKVLGPNVDPFAYVVSANIRRRHLSSEQKRDLIAALLKAAPEKSDRQIGETIKADHKTVGAIRSRLEGRGEIPHVAERKDTKDRRVKVKKPIAERVPSAMPQETTTVVTTPAVPASTAERNDIGPASVGETARLNVRISELENKNRLLESTKIGLQREIDERKTAEHNVPELLRLLPAPTKAALESRVVEHLTVADHLAALERKLPEEPKIRTAFKALEKALRPSPTAKSFAASSKQRTHP
jgi:hypothetical protein